MLLSFFLFRLLGLFISPRNTSHMEVVVLPFGFISKDDCRMACMRLGTALLFQLISVIRYYILCFPLYCAMFGRMIIADSCIGNVQLVVRN